MKTVQRIAGHRVDWQRGEVVFGKDIKSVEPKAMAVLKVLVQANGDVVTQQKILDAVWGDVVVAPNALQRCIAQLRKVFADDAKSQSVIKTHPKLGYSLVAKVNKNPVASVATNSRFKSYSLIVIAILALAFGLLKPPTQQSPDNTPKIKQLKMLTSADEAQYGGVIVDGKLIYIQGDNPRQLSIVRQNLSDGSSQVLARELWIEGGLSFDHYNNALLFSRLRLNGAIKCSEVAKLTLDSLSVETLLPCKRGFMTAPNALNAEQVLTIYRDYQGKTSLQRHDLSQGTMRDIALELGKLNSLAIEPQSDKLAIISADETQPYLTVGQLEDNEFKVLQQWPLGKDLFASNVRWHTPSKVIIAAEQRLKMFEVGNEAATIAIPSRDKLFAAMNYDDRILVELGREDWDVHSAPLLDSQEDVQSIARSIYRDFDARFRPQHQDISLLSDRSGSVQLWLQSKQQTQQLTSSQSDVSSYAWAPQGNSLVFVAGDELWSKVMGEQAQRVNLMAKPLRAYQWFDDSSPTALLSGFVENEQWLMEVNLATGSTRKIMKTDTQWSQRIGEQHYLTITADGYLQHIDLKGTLYIAEPIALTKDMKLQWRFIIGTDSGIYFQDKQQNIWRLSSDFLIIKRVGHYDENTLLMTDVDAKTGRFLSDAFMRNIRDFALLD